MSSKFFQNVRHETPPILSRRFLTLPFNAPKLPNRNCTQLFIVCRLDKLNRAALRLFQDVLQHSGKAGNVDGNPSMTLCIRSEVRQKSGLACSAGTNKD